MKKNKLYCTFLLGCVGIIGVFAYFVVAQPASNEAKGKAASIVKPSQKTKAADSWTTGVSKDEMTGEIKHFAHSKNTKPTREMSFPYQNVEAWLGIVCDGKKEWAYIGFTESPNLLNTDTEDGYHLVTTRIKWDDKVEDITLEQEWGGKSLHFNYDESIISIIAASKSVLLELNWYGSGDSLFKFSSGGAAPAIEIIRKGCAGVRKTKSDSKPEKEEIDQP